jgi:hypothetical protein
MTKSEATAGGLQEIRLEGRVHPLLYVLACVPILLAIFVVLLVAVETVSLPLLALLVMMVGTAGSVAFVAIETMLGGKLLLQPKGLTIAKPFSQVTLAWTELADAKVVPATGTFGDNPFEETDNRIGLGLFLHVPGRKRAHNQDADLILLATEKEHATRLMLIAEKLQAALKQSGQAPIGAGPGRARTLIRQAHQREQFRRRPAKATTAKDVVGQFRKS